jgi:hypothetical protein
MIGVFRSERIAPLNFESANPTVVKSIKQRDLLNTWLRLYARDQRAPRMEEASLRGSPTNCPRSAT